MNWDAIIGIAQRKIKNLTKTTKGQLIIVLVIGGFVGSIYGLSMLGGSDRKVPVKKVLTAEEREAERKAKLIEQDKIAREDAKRTMKKRKYLKWLKDRKSYYEQNDIPMPPDMPLGEE